MNITAENLRHWANCASLTSEQVSCLSVPQLNDLADIIDRLENEKSQLAAENSALKAAFSPKEIPTRVTDVFSDTAILKIDGDEFHSRQWVDNEEDVVLAVLAAIKPETPATDKIVDHQRAEGVEEFAAWQKGVADTYADLHPGSVGEQEARNAEKLALKFAAYLREGQHD